MDLRQLLSSTSASPGNVLKMVISISVVLLVMWLFMVSRMQLTENHTELRSDERIERSDSLRMAFRGEAAATEQVDPSGREQRPGIFFNAFTTFIVLISILAVVWVWARKRGVGNNRNGPFTFLHEQAAGHGVTLRVLELNGEIWVLGITSSSVNLLHRYPKEEWMEKVSEQEREETAGNSFLDHFKKQNREN